MAKSDEIDRWRKHLEEAEADLAAKTQQLEDTQSFLCGAITKLARVVNNDALQVNQEIEGIKKAAASSDNLAALKIAIESLTKKIINSEDDTQKNKTKAAVPGTELRSLLDKMSDVEGCAPQVLDISQRAQKISSYSELSIIIDDVAMLWEKSSLQQTTVRGDDPSNFCAKLISEILYQLLEKISFPKDVSVQLNELKKRLDEGVTVSKWAAMLDQISDVASEAQTKINRERLDIEEFLKQVTGRLKDLDSYILGSKEQHAEAWMHGKALGDAVKSEMQNLVSTANDAADLNVLKDQIQTRLAKIEEHVNGFRETEKTQHRNADEDVQRLMARLNELESESQNLKARVQKERMQAQIDTLTGIANRLGYDHRVAQEYARWKRFSNPLSLVVWDVDLFKRINDDFGHAAGDKALKTIAKLLAEQVRETDYLARYGGEEFVLIMPGADKDAAKVVAEKLRKTVEESGFHFKGKPVSITISGGIAEFKKNDTTGSVFERADKALYAAKEGGRNRVVVDK